MQVTSMTIGLTDVTMPENALTTPDPNAPTGTPTPAGTQGAVPPEAGSSPAVPPAVPEPPLTASVKARLDELTAEKWAKHREAAAAEARARVAEAALAQANQRLQSYAQPQPGAQPGERQPPPAAPTQDVETRAQQIAADRVFNDKCADAYNAGCAAFPDFQAKLNDLNRMVGQLPREFVEAALDTDKPHEALYKVASDSALADRIMKLPARKQVVELDRLVRGGATTPQPPVSGAPKPITPQVGRSAGAPPSLDDENVSMEDWISMREKDLKDRGVNRRLN